MRKRMLKGIRPVKHLFGTMHQSLNCQITIAVIRSQLFQKVTPQHLDHDPENEKFNKANI